MASQLHEQLSFVHEHVNERKRTSTMLPPREGQIYQRPDVGRQLDALDELREQLARHTGVVSERRDITAPTSDGWGIVVPTGCYRSPLHGLAVQERLRASSIDALTPHISEVVVPAAYYRPPDGNAVPQHAGTVTAMQKIAELLDDGQQALREGYPGTSLHIAKEAKAWLDWLPGPTGQLLAATLGRQIAALGERAYQELDRAPLARVLEWQRDGDND
jgi:hypothetical protein